MTSILDMKQSAAANAEIIRIDDHVFEKISDGFYRAKEPYEVNIRDWMMAESHCGCQALTNAMGTRDVATIRYVSINSVGATALMDLFLSSRKLGKPIGYIEGCPQEEFTVGDLYV
jgi:hypothetical protein